MEEFARMNNKEALAWAAGLFEGEGCFTACKHPNKPRKSDGGINYSIYLRAKLGICDKDVLTRFVKIIGYGKVNGPYYRKTNKPIYYWDVFNAKAHAVAKLLLPYLCGRRRDQLKRAIAKCGSFDTK